MSTSPVADGRRSNFTHTCNLLSQFLKDKRSSAALGLGITNKIDSTAATMDLLTNLDRQNATATPVDFLPQFVKHSNLRPAAPDTPQLTIFYGGKVLVFDAFPPEKATEVMELATNLGSEDHKTLPSAAEMLKEAPRPPPQAFGSDMRYPRRASLVKFLEKRKERVIARGPYHKHEGSGSGGDPEDQPSKRFDLNL